MLGTVGAGTGAAGSILLVDAESEPGCISGAGAGAVIFVPAPYPCSAVQWALLKNVTKTFDIQHGTERAQSIDADNGTHLWMRC